MHINIYRAFGFLLVLLRIVGGVFIVSFFSELATIFLLLSLDFGSSMDFETSSIFFPLLLTLRVPLRISLDSVFSLLLEATFLLRACLLVGVSKILQTSLVSSNFLLPLLDLVALISFFINVCCSHCCICLNLSFSCCSLYSSRPITLNFNYLIITYNSCMTPKSSSLSLARL